MMLLESIKRDWCVGLAVVLIAATVVSWVMDRDMRVNDDPYGNYQHSTGKMIKASRGPDAD